MSKQQKEKDDQRKEELKANEIELASRKKQEREEGFGTVGTMKRGDYLIHVFLQKAKDLLCPKNDTVNPMLEVNCMGKQAFSKTKNEIGSKSEITWNDHVFLEPLNVDRITAEKSKIYLKLVDKNFVRNKCIGEFDFDVSRIYFRKNHALLHKWIALSNPNEEDYSTITGYIKVSIAVTTVGDETIKLEEDRADQEDTEILMPPCLNPTFY